MGALPDGKAKINVIMPTNIRLKFYQNKDDVKLENKFAVIPIRIPLYSNIQNAYKPT